MVRIALMLAAPFVAGIVIVPWLREHWGQSGVIWGGGALVAFGLVCVLGARFFPARTASGDAD